MYTREQLGTPCSGRNAQKTEPEAHPQSGRESKERIRRRSVLRKGQSDRSGLGSPRESLYDVGAPGRRWGPGCTADWGRRLRLGGERGAAEGRTVVGTG